MKFRYALPLGLLFLAMVLSAAEPGIVFSGVMTTGEKTRIALTDTETRATTWIEPGGNFKGYTVARYDAKDEVVFLKKGGEEVRLSLATPAAPPAAPTVSSTTTPAPSAGRPLAPPAAPTGLTVSSTPPSADDAADQQPTGRSSEPPSYFAQPGDTLERISVRTGLSVQQLKQLNPGLPEGGTLPAGQPLRIK